MAQIGNSPHQSTVHNTSDLYARVSEILPSPYEERQFETRLGAITVSRSPQYLTVTLNGKGVAIVGFERTHFSFGNERTLKELVEAVKERIFINDLNALIEERGRNGKTSVEIGSATVEITKHLPSGEATHNYLLMFCSETKSSWFVALNHTGHMIEGNEHRMRYLREIVRKEVESNEPDPFEADPELMRDFFCNVLFSRNEAVGEVIIYRKLSGYPRAIYFEARFPEPPDLDFPESLKSSDADRERVESVMRNWISEAEKFCEREGMTILRRYERGLHRCGATVRLVI